MIFTGKNLQLVRDAIDGAIANIGYHIGSCPDVFEYAEDIEMYEQEKLKLERLMARIDRALARETNRRT